MPISQYPIRPYPWWFVYVPFISKTGFNTLFTDTIYLNTELFLDSQTDHPGAVTIAVIRHQEVHAHGASIGKAIRFVCSPDFRLQEEATAYRAQFHHLKQCNEPCDLDRIARQFTTIRYLWVMSYDDARRFVQGIWDTA